MHHNSAKVSHNKSEHATPHLLPGVRHPYHAQKQGRHPKLALHCIHTLHHSEAEPTSMLLQSLALQLGHAQRQA